MHLSKNSGNVTCFSLVAKKTLLRYLLVKRKTLSTEKKCLKICQQENEPKNRWNSPKTLKYKLRKYHGTLGIWQRAIMILTKNASMVCIHCIDCLTFFKTELLPSEGTSFSGDNLLEFLYPYFAFFWLKSQNWTFFEALTF